MGVDHSGHYRRPAEIDDLEIATRGHITSPPDRFDPASTYANSDVVLYRPAGPIDQQLCENKLLCRLSIHISTLHFSLTN
jgi:hypothetical protein